MEKQPMAKARTPTLTIKCVQPLSIKSILVTVVDTVQAEKMLPGTKTKLRAPAHLVDDK